MEEFLSRKNSYDKRMNGLERQIKELELVMQEKKICNEEEDGLKRLIEMDKIYKLTRGMVKEFVERIDVYKGDSIKISWTFL